MTIRATKSSGEFGELVPFSFAQIFFCLSLTQPNSVQARIQKLYKTSIRFLFELMLMNVQKVYPDPLDKIVSGVYLTCWIEISHLKYVYHQNNIPEWIILVKLKS